LEELPALVKAPGEMVRRAAAGLACDALVCLLSPPTLVAAAPGGGSPGASGPGANGNGNGDGVAAVPAPDGDGDAMLLPTSLRRLRAQAAAFLETLAQEFDASTGVMYEAARARAPAGGDAAAAAPPPPPPPEADVFAAEGDGQLIDGDEDDDEEDGDGDSVLVQGEEEGAMEVDPGDGDGGAAAAAALRAATAQVAFVTELAVQLLSSTTSAASPWLVRVLPSLLRLQELVPSEQQAVSLAARKALVAFKYQPLGPGDAGAALAALERGARAELWPERAASLGVMQYFWFRHALLVGREGTRRVLGAVLARLSDDKLEVRGLAAATLSGLLRGLPEAEAEALRRRSLARAAELFPGRRRRRVGGGGGAAAAAPPPPAPLPERHGAALALQAFVLSSPYDVPPWLPDVLMALVRLASEPAPIRCAPRKHSASASPRCPAAAAPFFRFFVVVRSRPLPSSALCPAAPP
jgi:hypothetical protein